ncbi:MAG: hypothetical protein KC731_03005 [Myxococcales bacterium]|nr:hypothetical protein [Myxococcales bacterium]
MQALPWLLVGVGFVAVLIGWGTYLAAIPKGVPDKPLAALAATQGGAVAALAGLAWSSASPTTLGWLLWIAAPTVALTGLGFALLYSQRKVPAGELQVRVGAPMIDFETVDHTGQPFATSSLRGQRVLLKFFRGSW